MSNINIFSLATLLLGAIFQKCALAVVWPAPVIPPMIAAIVADTKGGNGTFQQLIDHSNPGLGTFSQRYWWNTTFWEGPGSPVVIFTPGEISAEYYTGFLTNRTITGLYAQAIGAAVIVLEHRYWGKSSPFEILDTGNLTYLTLENSVADLTHFARTVKLPFDTKGQSNAPAAPWVLVGGSYSGALAAWTEKLSPKTFWAYHASSAPVQAIRDFWTYFHPIQYGMPKNCSVDMVRIADHVDSVLTRHNESEIQELKTMFGLEKVEHDDDFAGALASPLAEWQGIGLTSNYSTFFKMCDSVQGVRPVNVIETDETDLTQDVALIKSNVSDTGVGLETALPNFASWFKHEFLPDICENSRYSDWNDSHSIACFDSYNETSPIYTDLSVGNLFNRQWFWMLCNEPFFYWQGGAPRHVPSLVSRYITPTYFERQCPLFFPSQGNTTFGAAIGRTENMLNHLTDGWLVNTTRLLWVNGQFDPWRSASVSSVLRPGGPRTGTEKTPVYLIKGARHCDDLDTRSGEVNEDVRQAQLSAIAQMVGWVGEFYDMKARGVDWTRVEDDE